VDGGTILYKMILLEGELKHGLFIGFIREATLQWMLLQNYPVVLSGLNFYAKYTIEPQCALLIFSLV
jgi:hypothetical protein